MDGQGFIAPVEETVHVETGLHVTPDPISFGCLCHGYIYSMNLRLHNHTQTSVRIRAEISPCRLEDDRNEVTLSFVPIQIAPGMSTTMGIRINCNYSGTFKYNFTVHYGLYQKSTLNKRIVAYVLPLELFKNTSKQLAVNKKKILQDNVKTVARVFGGSQMFSGKGSPTDTIRLDTGSANTASTTIYTAELLDNDDIDELADIPMMPYCQYDHGKGLLSLDSKLLEVVIDSKADLKTSKKNTREKRETRLKEIEDAGRYTKRGIENIVEARGRDWQADTTNLIDLVAKFSRGYTANGVSASATDGKDNVDENAESLALHPNFEDPFQNVRLVDCSSTISEGTSVVVDEAMKDILNPYGHIRGIKALGSVNGRVPSRKPQRNTSIGSAGGVISPKSPKGTTV